MQMEDMSEYNSWYCMRERCINPYCPSYRNYGKKGIKLCDEWLYNFQVEKQQKLIEYNSKIQNISEWAREIGIPPTTLNQRLNGYGWSIEKALTTPLMRQKP